MVHVCLLPIVDAKAYYRQHLKAATQQPHKKWNVPPSIMEWDAIKLTAAQEWEAEWNELGLRSGLSEQVKSHRLMWILKYRQEYAMSTHCQISEYRYLSDRNVTSAYVKYLILCSSVTGGKKPWTSWDADSTSEACKLR